MLLTVGDLVRTELEFLSSGPAQALRDWFLEFSNRVPPNRLVGLMMARMADISLSSSPRTSKSWQDCATLAEVEEMLLTAYHQLFQLGPAIVPACEWWVRHRARGEASIIELIESYLTSQSGTDSEKRQVRARVVSSGLEVSFNERELDSPAAFTCRTQGPVLLITLNTNHPAYSTLAEVLRSAHQGAARALLASWALMETELPEGVRRDRVSEVRLDWGRTIRRLLNDEGLRACIDS